MTETLPEGYVNEVILESDDKNNIEIRIHMKKMETCGLSCDLWHTAYIGLGSNIGNSEEYLNSALKKMSEHPQIEVDRVSTFIRTKPVGPVAQPDFLNACARLKTSLPPMELLRVLQQLEQEAGRTREIHWGPRTLDLDILLYDDLVSEDKTLTLPHPEMHKRLFVLDPMCEIAPEAVHPGLGKSMEELRANLQKRASG